MDTEIEHIMSVLRHLDVGKDDVFVGPAYQSAFIEINVEGPNKSFALTVVPSDHRLGPNKSFCPGSIFRNQSPPGPGRGIDLKWVAI